MWWLILIVSYTGVHMEHIEFLTKEKCEIARDALKKDVAEEFNRSFGFVARCVERQ